MDGHVEEKQDQGVWSRGRVGAVGDKVGQEDMASLCEVSRASGVGGLWEGIRNSL